MWDLLKVIAVCGTLLFCTFLVLLAMPKSRLRCFILEICGWVAAVLAGAYIVSPIDMIPDWLPIVGWIDDAGALVGGITAAITALSARRDRKLLD